MSATPKLTAAVTASLEDLHTRIAENDPLRADSFIGELLAKMDVAAEHPRAWPRMPGGRPTERYISHGDYIIGYEIAPDAVIITKLFHAALDLTGGIH